MPSKQVTQSGVSVTPISTVVWSEPVTAFSGAGIWVKNTGANAVSVWIETKQSASATYAVRPVEDLLSLAPGEAKQFDADISQSQFLGLLAQASGGTSTVDIDILFTQRGGPW